MVPIGSIDANPLQPRSIFQPERLRELSDSILANGIIQPLIVRTKGERYELIAGERRWRAAKLAGLTEVPVVIQNLVDERVLEVSLIENIQREDLNPIEVAEAFDRLCREMGMSHEEIAKRTGKDRSTVTNMIRLLRLPEQVQVLLAERKLSMGHARAILGVEKPELQLSLADKAAAEGMSVRQVERAVQKLNEEREPTEAKAGPKLDPNVKAAVEELERFLGTRVKIEQKGQGRGKIEIEFYSMEDLDRIYSLVVREENE
ncbi:MAG: ParB/RepB/Spo0J family partition protein [Acidobacteria bacterium]|nr:ParB/RepB/Spo0J family partition protein [Acidobacteriota bacterium]